jgi:spore coat polysaccharide biosynthesis protein SpsF (cytidylyltransferase family)
VNNVPFGVSAELFSTKYLWELYLKMDNPMHSEYLTLFILQDENAKKGCIDIESGIKDLKYINLSVDFQADYDRALALASKYPNKDLYTLSLSDLVSEIDSLDREDKNKMIKLPEGEEVKFSEFLDRLATQNYAVRKKIIF